MEDAPSLELEILNGPRKGETLQFKPGFTVKIGRVVRGNNLPIKDPGISTKHLSIQIDSGNWTILDLDSSNGTVLDGVTLPPNTPFHLSDGSVVKIGEVTSIAVNFIKPQNNATVSTEVEGKPMRGKRGNNKSNKGVNSRVPVQSIDEFESGNVVQLEPTRVTRSTRSMRSGNNVVSDSAAGNLDVIEEKVDEPKKNTRATRNLKTKQKTVTFSGLSIGDSEAQEEKVEELKSGRVTRNAKNKNKQDVIGISEPSIVDLDDVEENVEKRKNVRVTRNGKNKNKQNVIGISETSIVDLDVVEEKVEETKSARVTRNAKNKRKVIEISESTVVDLDAVEEKVEEPKNVRVTRNSKNKGIVIGENSSLADGVVDVEKKKTRGGAKGKKKLQEECVDDGDGKDICDEKDNKNLNKDDSLNMDENWPDLNKISLGEWFDFLEVFLPKQTNDETEAIIDSMRQKVERLREYVIMYQNQKA